MNTRWTCFVQYFILVLAMAVVTFYSTLQGLPQRILALDESHFTSVVALLILYTVFRFGVLSWRLNASTGDEVARRASWGVFVTFASPLLGIIGTAFGLSLQSDVLASGGAGQLGPLGTSLYTTMVGCGGGLVAYVLYYNVMTCVADVRAAAGEATDVELPT